MKIYLGRSDVNVKVRLGEHARNMLEESPTDLRGIPEILV